MSVFVPMMPLNFSRLKHLADSPLHFKAACEQVFEETDPMRLGQATHCLIYEPGEFDNRFEEWTGGRRFGREWDEFCDEHADITILTPNQVREARAIADSVRAHPTVAEWLSGPAAAIEERIYWTDSETGLALAGTPDYVGSDYVIDLKTTSNALPRQFATYAARSHYPAQLAMYRDGLHALGCTIRECRWIVVESKPPHDVIPYVVPEHVVDEGQREYRGWLRTVLDCIADQRWPGRVPGVEEFLLPEWAFKASDEMVI